MSLIYANRVHEACSAVGVQNLTLLGPLTGKASFNSKIPTGKLVPYILLDGNGAAYEIGFGTLLSANELQRTTVMDSSATEDRVNSETPGTPIKISLSTNQHEVFIAPFDKTVFSKDEDGAIADPGAIRASLFVDTIAELTALENLEADETVFVRGSAALGDGLGGCYRWDPSDVGAEANPETYAHDTEDGLFKKVRFDIQGIFLSGDLEVDAKTADSVGASIYAWFRKKATAATAWARWHAAYAAGSAAFKLGIRHLQSSAEKFFIAAISIGDNFDRIEFYEPAVQAVRTNANGLKNKSLAFLSGVSRLAVARADAAASGSAAEYWEIPLTKGGFLTSVVATVTALKAIDAAGATQDDDKALVLGNAAIGDCEAFYVKWSAASTATADDFAVFRPSVGAAASGAGRWLRVNVSPTAAFTNSDATPSVKNGSWFTTAGTPPASITAFDDCFEGQVFTIQRGSVDQIIANNGSISNGGVSITLTTLSPRATYRYVGGVAYLIARGGQPPSAGIDPRNYGAVGGGTNDTTAFENAADAAVAANLPLMVPAGTWDVAGFTPPTNLRMMGAGIGITVMRRMGSSSTGVGIMDIQTNNTRYEHITFDGNKANNTNGANSVYAQTSGAYNARFDFCEFKNAKAVSGSWGTGLTFTTTGDTAQEQGSVARNCKFSANDADGIGLKEAYNVDFSDNMFRQNGGSGINVANFDSPVENASQRMILISRNMCLDNTSAGIVIHGFTTGSSTVSSPIWGNASQTTWWVTISDNVCRHNDGYGIAFQGSHSLVTNNQCHENGGTGITVAGILFNADFSQCIGNQCYNNEYYGIDAGGSYRCTIGDNVCQFNGLPSSSNGGTGINLGACRDTMCSRNTCYDNGDANAGTQILCSQYDAAGNGIGFAWSADNVIIENNHVSMNNNNQIGIWIRQGPKRCIVRNNLFRGGTENNSLRLECHSQGYIVGNRHTSFIGGTTVASAATLVIPDYAEDIIVTGTTNVTGGVQRYSRDAFTGKVCWVNITGAGTGFTSAPTIGITGGTGTGFAATAYITNSGVIAGIIVTNPGSGFNGSETVTITGGGGSGATATLQIGCPNHLGGPLRLIFGGVLTFSATGGNTFLNGAYTTNGAGTSLLTLYGYYGTNFHEQSRGA